MKLTEVVEHPADLQEALRETVKILDTCEDEGSDREIQEDLEAVADFLDSSPEGIKLGRYIWRNRYEEEDDDD